MNVEQVTKYGRSFSIVRVPYVFKLFMQELQTMNIRMALITEDNVNQFDSMNFSANISLLSGLKTPNDIIKQIIENKDADEIVKRNKNVFRKIGEQKYTPDYDKPDVLPTISPSVAQRTASIGEARTPVEEETYVEAWHNVPEAPYDNMYGSPEGSPVANPYGSPEGSPLANPYGSPEGSPLGTPDLRVPGIVFADSVNNLPPGYNSEGKVLYNEETGADYIFDPSIGHYIDPLTQKIVIRKDFVQQQQQPTFKIGDIVYLMSSASSPNQWTITNIMDKNIILENTGTKAAKVVSADEITHTPPMSGGAVQQTSRSAIHEGTPSGITFAPNIIIASGDNSQITAPKPVINEQPHIDFDKPLIKTTQTTGSSSDNSYSNDSLSGDKSSGDKSSTQDLSSGDLSTGGFVVKMV
jgi:hypothetical protein